MKPQRLKFSVFTLVIVTSLLNVHSLSAQQTSLPDRDVKGSLLSQRPREGTEPGFLVFLDLTASSGCTLTFTNGEKVSCAPATVYRTELVRNSASLTQDAIYVEIFGDSANEIASAEEQLVKKANRILGRPTALNVPKVSGSVTPLDAICGGPVGLDFQALSRDRNGNFGGVLNTLTYEKFYENGSCGRIKVYTDYARYSWGLSSYWTYVSFPSVPE